MNIAIEPVSIWTSTGTKTAVAFNVRYVNYQNGPAIADTILLDESGAEVATQLVNATADQTAQWDGADDAPFYEQLAINAGLTPIGVVSEPEGPVAV
jgi:hypothetical protein